MKYDVFLSHADADKDSFVEELKESFSKLGISIFYDNWKQKIYDGLSHCKYGVIVVSKNFLIENGPKKNLKSCFPGRAKQAAS